MIRVADLNKAFGALRAVHDLSFEAQPRPDHVDHRSERGGQEHRVQSDRRHAVDRIRAGGIGWPRHHRPTALRPGAARRRALVPDHQSVLRTERFGERAGSPARASRTAQPLISCGWIVCRAPAIRADEILEEFGLDDRADELVGNLSHGDQRRIEIALCMALEPKLLMLDEPTQGMSPSETAEVDALIKSLAGPGHGAADRARYRSGHEYFRSRGGHAPGRANCSRGRPAKCAPAQRFGKPIWEPIDAAA